MELWRTDTMRASSQTREGKSILLARLRKTHEVEQTSLGSFEFTGISVGLNDPHFEHLLVNALPMVLHERRRPVAQRNHHANP